jgi:hypothetical protein
MVVLIMPESIRCNVCLLGSGSNTLKVQVFPLATVSRLSGAIEKKAQIGGLRAKSHSHIRGSARYDSEGAAWKPPLPRYYYSSKAP